LFGLTRGSGRAQIVRAVLEGIAHRGTDLVEAAEAAP
jgi:glycerol kinase